MSDRIDLNAIEWALAKVVKVDDDSITKLLLLDIAYSLRVIAGRDTTPSPDDPS